VNTLSSDQCAECGEYGKVMDTRPAVARSANRPFGSQAVLRGIEIQRQLGGYRRRRYACACGHRWTTYEFTAEDIYKFLGEQMEAA
jgi:hypothetical protein